MKEIKNKNILILSPQPWNDLKLSKHHYASTLAKMGNNVLFVCAADAQIGIQLKTINPKDQPSKLLVASYKIPIPEIFKFKIPKLYNYLNWFFVKLLLKRTFGSIDICIDFGHHTLFNDLSKIKARKKILFPVDDFEKLKPDMRGAEIGFSVSKVIVEKFQNAGLNFHFINHGLANDFIEAQKGHIPTIRMSERIKVGYSGNLMIPFLDRDLFKQIIEENQQVEFHCFGKYDSVQNTANQKWGSWLKEQANVILHGMLETSTLAEKMQEMDAFILMYKPDGKNYHAENSHKILEYLSTGKVVISTPILLYKNSTMVETSKTSEFVADFKKIILTLSDYNSPNLIEQRIHFATNNSYKNLVYEIFRR